MFAGLRDVRGGLSPLAHRRVADQIGEAGFGDGLWLGLAAERRVECGDGLAQLGKFAAEAVLEGLDSILHGLRLIVWRLGRRRLDVKRLAGFHRGHGLRFKSGSQFNGFQRLRLARRHGVGRCGLGWWMSGDLGLGHERQIRYERCRGFKALVMHRIRHVESKGLFLDIGHWSAAER